MMKEEVAKLFSIMLCATILADFSALAGVNMQMDEDPNPLSGSPKTIWVDDDFTDDPANHKWDSVQEGVSDANHGDTVYVFSGNYYEHVLIDRIISLTGEDMNTTIIDGGGVDGDVIWIKRAWVNVTGFTITNGGDGYSPYYDAGITVSTYHNRIWGNNISGNLYAGVTLGGRYSTVSDNIISSNSLGIHIFGGYNTISGNNFTRNSRHAIDAYWNVDGNTILENTMSYNGYDGGRDVIILGPLTSRFTISENVISSNRGSGIHIAASEYHTILNNTISDNQGAGVDVDNSAAYNTVLGNDIILNMVGVVIRYRSNNNTISRNNISSNYNRGIGIWDPSRDNMIHGNNVSSNGWDGIVVGEGGVNNMIYHNNIIDHTNQAEDADPANSSWHHPILLEGNYWSDYTGVDDGSGTGKHAIAGDGIGDTLIPHPDQDYDYYPYVEPDGWISSPIDRPIADAGPDQTVNEGDTVQFDGTGSQGGGGGTRQWVWKAHVPSFRMGAGSATLDDEMYFIGGVGSDDGMGKLLATDTVEKYNPADDAWYEPTSLPEPRSGLGAAAVGGNIYVIGGNNGTNSTDTTFEFDPVTGIWIKRASMPMPLEGFGIATVSDKIYIMGGYSTLIDCYPCGSTYEYDPAVDNWTQKTDLPTGRNAPAAVALDGKIFAIGGDANGLMDEVEVYDPATDKWTVAADMIGPRSHLRAEALGGDIYVMGGYEDLGAPWTVHVYNPSLDNWTVLGPQLVEPRIAPGSGVVSSCIYLFGGHSGHMIGVLSLNEQYCLDGELNFEWDFDASVDSDGDGNFTNDVDGTGPTPTHVYADDGNYTVTLKVIDGAGLWDTDTCIITVLNVPPTADANGPYNSFEGTPVQFTGNHTDPGPLDTHTYEWDFSYDGTTFNPEATGNPYQNTWYDDHTGNIALRVTDDDGGWDLDVTTVTIVNVPPIANAGDDKEGLEVSTFTFNGSFYDPGAGDTHTFEWDFDYDGVSFDSDSTGQTATHTWTDDFDGLIALRVTDDDGGSDMDTAQVLVKNVPPTVTLEVLPIEVDAFLRIAGEKWHDVSIELFEDGVLIANGTLVRYPGSPDGQMLDLSNLQFDHSKKYTATVTYTPEDDPVNGQTNGANPCWIILRFDDGQELWIHHTFNVNHPDTYVWEVDLTAAILSHGMTFEAIAFDPGADELTFTWDFGDGTNATSFYANGNGTYPVQITVLINHVFPGSGTYVVVLTVEDDDGGVGTASLTIVIP